MRQIDKYSKIGIIGAGIAGPALAISLKNNGFNNVQLY
jgi:2-polyprenyl-6-methoxyphenol hydroxylase-like FAD-dependent oxidoreductase